MNKTTRNTTIALAIGTAFNFVLPAAQAAGNPFAMQMLEHGYMVADAAKAPDGKCGAAKTPVKVKDGKCAGNKEPAVEKTKDGKCAANKDAEKVKDGKCAADKKAMPEDKTSSASEPVKDAATGKTKDGKCGEGKCGANKGKAKSTKPDA